MPKVTVYGSDGEPVGPEAQDVDEVLFVDFQSHGRGPVGGSMVAGARRLLVSAAHTSAVLLEEVAE